MSYTNNYTRKNQSTEHSKQRNKDLPPFIPVAKAMVEYLEDRSVPDNQIMDLARLIDYCREKKNNGYLPWNKVESICRNSKRAKLLLKYGLIKKIDVKNSSGLDPISSELASYWKQIGIQLGADLEIYRQFYPEVLNPAQRSKINASNRLGKGKNQLKRKNEPLYIEKEEEKEIHTPKPPQKGERETSEYEESSPLLDQAKNLFETLKKEFPANKVKKSRDLPILMKRLKEDTHEQILQEVRGYLSFHCERYPNEKLRQQYLSQLSKVLEDELQTDLSVQNAPNPKFVQKAQEDLDFVERYSEIHDITPQEFIKEKYGHDLPYPAGYKPELVEVS